jgi:hypothetical protein
MFEGIDYCFIYPKDDDKTVNIKFLAGPYKDVIFRYGRVKIEPEGDQAYLRFHFDVIESPNIKIKKLEKDIDFRNYIGNLLNDLITANLNQVDIDETDADDNKESDL